ncbi:glucosamine-6-phosphate isomerase [Purpureocillium lavendulum]|uniref:Glucosamine-6-phosphate isomerase n=1 Tax=Purpureocillium lavendulum TaxID=1247861 RepID=A0AB34FCT3_9HYPO|nr:glucosamine-6-phosphate isomerase [Purpureocillium lavendulum]
MELFAQILALRTGEALLFSPSAVIGIRDLTRDGITIEDSPYDTESRASYSTSTDSDSDDSEVKAELLRLGHNFMKVVVRQRITQDGGRSVMAA